MKVTTYPQTCVLTSDWYPTGDEVLKEVQQVIFTRGTSGLAVEAYGSSGVCRLLGRLAIDESEMFAEWLLQQQPPVVVKGFQFTAAFTLGQVVVMRGTEEEAPKEGALPKVRVGRVIGVVFEGMQAPMYRVRMLDTTNLGIAQVHECEIMDVEEWTAIHCEDGGDT